MKALDKTRALLKRVWERFRKRLGQNFPKIFKYPTENVSVAFTFSYTDYKTIKGFVPGLESNRMPLEENNGEEPCVLNNISLLRYFIRRRLLYPLKTFVNMMNTQIALDESIPKLVEGEIVESIAEDLLFRIASFNYDNLPEVLIAGWALRCDPNLKQFCGLTRSMIYISPEVYKNFGIDNIALQMDDRPLEISLLEDELYIMIQKLKYAQAMITFYTKTIHQYLNSTSAGRVVYEVEKPMFGSFKDLEAMELQQQKEKTAKADTERDPSSTILHAPSETFNNQLFPGLILGDKVLGTPASQPLQTTPKTTESDSVATTTTKTTASVIAKKNKFHFKSKRSADLMLVFLDEAFMATVDLLRLVLLTQAYQTCEPSESIMMDIGWLKREMRDRIGRFMDQAMSRGHNPMPTDKLARDLVQDIWNNLNQTFIRLSKCPYIAEFRSYRKFTLIQATTMIARYYMRKLLVSILTDIVDFIVQNWHGQDWHTGLKQLKNKMDIVVNRATMNHIKDDLLALVSTIKYVNCNYPDWKKNLTSECSGTDAHLALSQCIGLIRFRILIAHRADSPLYADLVRNIAAFHTTQDEEADGVSRGLRLENETDGLVDADEPTSSAFLNVESAIFDALNSASVTSAPSTSSSSSSGVTDSNSTYSISSANGNKTTTSSEQSDEKITTSTSAQSSPTSTTSGSSSSSSSTAATKTSSDSSLSTEETNGSQSLYVGMVLTDAELGKIDGQLEDTKSDQVVDRAESAAVESQPVRSSTQPIKVKKRPSIESVASLMLSSRNDGPASMVKPEMPGGRQTEDQASEKGTLQNIQKIIKKHLKFKGKKLLKSRRGSSQSPRSDASRYDLFSGKQESLGEEATRIPSPLEVEAELKETKRSSGTNEELITREKLGTNSRPLAAAPAGFFATIDSRDMGIDMNAFSDLSASMVNLYMELDFMRVNAYTPDLVKDEMLVSYITLAPILSCMEAVLNIGSQIILNIGVKRMVMDKF